MRFTFLTCLFGLIFAAFAVTVGYSHVRFRSYAESRAVQTMSARLTDLMELLVHSDEHMHIMQKNMDHAAMQRTRAAAEILRLNPSILDNQEELQGLCNDIGAKQLFVTDAEGNFTAALPEEEKGSNIYRFDNAEAFMKCARHPGYEAIQRPGDISEESTSMLYTSVHRDGADGAVILGFAGVMGQSFGADSSYASLAQNYDLGAHGYIIAFKNGALLGDEASPFPTADLISLPLNKGHLLRLADGDYFTYAIRQGEYMLVGLMPVWEQRKSSWRALYPVLISNGILFLAIFFLVFYLLQRLVIRNISRLNASLRKITQGDAKMRTDMQDSPIEFRRLSQNINSMVDALQAAGKKSDEAVARDMELARSIQEAIVPHAYPAFPERTEFDLFANCRRAKHIGGGVYDYFMLNDDKLCFMMADASGNGVPAALFALHSLAIVRSLALTGASPTELVINAHTALSGKQFGGMSLSLFYGVLDLHTGQMEFVNAGMPQALICRKESSYVYLNMQSSPPIGRSAEPSAIPCTCCLASGDRLFFYSEGVIDSTDTQGLPYGMAQLQEALNQPASAIADLPRRVSQQLRKFTQGSPQEKDAVMLAIEYIGKHSNTASLTYTAGAPHEADAFIASHLESVFASPLSIAALQRAVRRLSIALPHETQARLALDYDEETARLTLSYPGPVFDPLSITGELGVDHVEFIPSSDGDNMVSLSQSLA